MGWVPENKLLKVKAKRMNDGKWIKGYCFKEQECTYLITGRQYEDIIHSFTHVTEECYDMFSIKAYKIDPGTICLCTGKEYMNGETAYEGDIFESQAGGQLMILRFGTYQAYCPVDETYMDSVGFYAECEGYPDMPIGDLKDYALKVGNIFDNPELLRK